MGVKLFESVNWTKLNPLPYLMSLNTMAMAVPWPISGLKCRRLAPHGLVVSLSNFPSFDNWPSVSSPFILDISRGPWSLQGIEVSDSPLPLTQSSYSICIWRELEDMSYLWSKSSPLHHHQMGAATVAQGFELLDSCYVRRVIVLDALKAFRHPEDLSHR